MRLLAMLCLLVSCGTGAKVIKPEPDRRKQEIVKDCQGNLVEQGELKPGYRYVDGNRLYVKNSDSKRVSLCDASKGHKVMIFQLAGITCLSCQYESEFIVKDVVTKEVGHAVVFTDFREDYTESDFKDFMNRHAKESKRYHDENISMWKMFSADPAKPTRPTILVFGKEGVSFVYNSEGESIKGISEVASSLGAQPLPPPDPEPGPKPDTEPGPTLVDFEMQGVSGEQKALSEVFTKEFALIDFSQTNCIYCKRSAKKFNEDDSFQSTVANGKCDFLTLIPTSDLSSWGGLFGQSFVGKSSYAPVEGTREAAAKFGFALRATPSFILVDRNGRLLDSRTGALPRSFFETCSN